MPSLKWDANTSNICKKSYARMELLRKLAGFNPPKSDMKNVYIVYIRSLLEQSSNVWHSGLTIQNEIDLERVQKVALKLILKENYKSYEHALNYLELDTLKQRRIDLSLTFARKCLKSKKIKYLFPPNNGIHTMMTRNHEHFQVMHAHTNRLQESPVIYMQNQLNIEIQRKKEFDKIWND